MTGVQTCALPISWKPLPQKVAIYFHALEPADHAAFGRCIAYFVAQGYRIVHPDVFVSDATGARLLFVSFDDNYANWHAALPLLSKLQVAATFYVNTLPLMDLSQDHERSAYFRRIDYATDRRSLTQAQVREIAADGHTIGCHSHSHADLAKLDPADWDAEIKGCRIQLERLLNKPVEHFAYPFGMRRYFSAPLRDYCRAIGFKTVAAGIPGLQHAAPVDPFNIHRTRWQLHRSVEGNIADIRIDGRRFEAWTGRSAVG